MLFPLSFPWESEVPAYSYSPWNQLLLQYIDGPLDDAS